MGRKLITILLIAVFAITTLPLQQVGRMLYDNQWTEELSEHAENKAKHSGYSIHPFDQILESRYKDQAFANGLTYVLNYRQALPAKPCGEILVPPPNFG